MPPVTLGIHGPKARAYICHTVYRDNGPEGTPRWGCALPLGPPVPSLGGVCALSVPAPRQPVCPVLGTVPAPTGEFRPRAKFALCDTLQVLVVVSRQVRSRPVRDCLYFAKCRSVIMAGIRCLMHGVKVKLLRRLLL